MSSVTMTPNVTDRRRPLKSDLRRTAILDSLDEYLQQSSFESINIADISRRAGVTRSAFYFYFDSKAAAVAALVERMYDDAAAATDILTGDTGTPQTRIRASIVALFDAWNRNRYLFEAMFEARASSPAVREMWDADRHSFIGPVATMIAAERDAGRAPDGPDTEVLATVLLEFNDRMLERLMAGGPLNRDQLVEGAETVWLRTIYGAEAGS